MVYVSAFQLFFSRRTFGWKTEQSAELTLQNTLKSMFTKLIKEPLCFAEPLLKNTDSIKVAEH